MERWNSRMERGCMERQGGRAAWSGRGGSAWDLDAAYHAGTVGSVRGAVKLEGACRGVREEGCMERPRRAGLSPPFCISYRRINDAPLHHTFTRLHFPHHAGSARQSRHDHNPLTRLGPGPL